ncbi:helix-turn-helix domain-containing protein [Mycobacterium asiaticum]|uniref:Helix-turn-helix domain-containing protein n=1 Tax=Mycobacterium asiaticum TaxID=1790 RepID=A0A1A3BH26_MYCAS|nr:helix-turn-helix domain-containing protein [Mycobacterium asiaticum]OBI72716.1 hypothetical protein A9X01_07620 [Mycobacterium asiaticum]
MDSDTGRLLVPYDEAMRMLGGIGRTTFYELMATGEIEQVKIGRRGFITSKWLTCWAMPRSPLPVTSTATPATRAVEPRLTG